MLIPISLYQVSKIVPSVATGGQFKYALGDPRKILQRLIISSIGGVITFLISVSQDRNQTYSLWLLLCVLFFLYILWGPIVEASKKNLKFRSFKFFSISLIDKGLPISFGLSGLKISLSEVVLDSEPYSFFSYSNLAFN